MQLDDNAVSMLCESVQVLETQKYLNTNLKKQSIFQADRFRTQEQELEQKIVKLEYALRISAMSRNEIHK